MVRSTLGAVADDEPNVGEAERGAALRRGGGERRMALDRHDLARTDARGLQSGSPSRCRSRAPDPSVAARAAPSSPRPCTAARSSAPPQSAAADRRRPRCFIASGTNAWRGTAAHRVEDARVAHAARHDLLLDHSQTGRRVVHRADYALAARRESSAIIPPCRSRQARRGAGTRADRAARVG